MKSNIISPSATIGDDTGIGAYTVIEDNVQIGAGCLIGSNVVIHAGTVIADNVRIDDCTVIGKQPLRSIWSIMKESAALKGAVISDNVLIGAQVVIYAGCVIGNDILIADSASVRENVTVNEKTIIGRLVTIEQDCTIGKRCKLETGCYITAFSCVGDFCFIAPNVTTTNDNFLGRTEERFKHFKGVTIRNGGRIGANATILPGREIGEDAVVAAGSVVTSDVEKNTIVMGIPARYRKDVPPEQLLKNQNWTK